MQISRKLLVSGLMMASSLVSGCVQPTEVNDALTRADQSQSEIKDRLAASTLEKVKPRRSVLKVEENAPYIGLTEIDTRQVLPERLRGPHALALPNVNELTSLSEFRRTLQINTHIPVNVVGDAVGEVAPVSEALTASVNVNGNRWLGPVDQLLDTVCDHFGYEWQYVDDSIEIIRRKTAVIKLQINSQTKEYESIISAGTQSNDTSEGSTNLNNNQQQATSRLTYDPWSEIEEQLAAFSENGNAAIKVARHSGDITVSGRPVDVERVKSFAKQLNQTVLGRVNLAIWFIRVDREESADYQLNLEFALADVLGSAGLNYAVDGASSVLGIIKGGDAPVTNTVNTTIKALNTVGTVSRSFKVGIPAQNRMRSDWNNTNLQTYPESSTSTVSGDTVTQDVNVNSITAGLQLNVTPNLLDARTVSVDLNLSIQDPASFEDYTLGDNTYKLISEYKSRSISVPLVLESGDIYVLNGFQDLTTSTTQGGVGSAENWWLGGMSQGGTKTTEHLILVTADVPPPTELRITEYLGKEF